jgi:hypothetical protein
MRQIATSGVSEKQEIVVAGHLEDIVLVITTSFGEFGDYPRIKKIRETRLIIYERSRRRKMAFFIKKKLAFGCPVKASLG